MEEGSWTIERLADELGGALDLEHEAERGRVITGVSGIEIAGPQHLSFVSNRRYVRRLATTRAGVVLLDPDTPREGRNAIRMEDPYAGFARALALFQSPRPVSPGVHSTAWVAPDAQVEGAEIRPLAYVGAGARVGVGTIIDPGCYVGAGARVGQGCHIMATAVIADGCVVGDRVVLNPGAVVGAEGFGFAPTPQGHVKIPQAGRAVLEDDVELGANTCVDRAAMGDTIVRRGAKLDNLVQVGHAAEIGEHSLLVAFAGVAGSTRLGRFVTLAAKAGVLGHLRIGDHVMVGTRGLVTADLPDGAHVSGHPAFDHRRWRRAALALRTLPDLLRQVRKLNTRLSRVEALLADTDKEESP